MFAPRAAQDVSNIWHNDDGDNPCACSIIFTVRFDLFVCCNGFTMLLYAVPTALVAMASKGVVSATQGTERSGPT
eukprot:3231754-Amphidinium_carterae.1